MDSANTSAQNQFSQLLKAQRLPEFLKAGICKTIGTFIQLPVCFEATDLSSSPTSPPEDLMAALIRFESPAVQVEVFLGIPREFVDILCKKMFTAPLKKLPTGEHLACELLSIGFGETNRQLSNIGKAGRYSFPIGLPGDLLRKLNESSPFKSESFSFVYGGKNVFLNFYPAGSFDVAWRFDS